MNKSNSRSKQEIAVKPRAHPAAFISAIDYLPEQLITMEIEPAYDPKRFCTKTQVKE